jgi:LPXTG-motif cell wall-anchored protein
MAQNINNGKSTTYLVLLIASIIAGLLVFFSIKRKNNRNRQKN